jgi:DNA-binding transcriptional regulator YbjK
MATDRRTRIADAVIETLADVGSRGLTHRAVDEAAGLPTGSTSYYLRTRASLLEAAVHRLAELDAALVAPLSGTSVGAALARLVERQLGTHRTRLLARYELSLEAVRRPELRAALVAGTERVREALSARLAADGIADADRTAVDALAMIEGLLFTELTSGDEHRRGRNELRRSIDRVIGG